MSLSLNHDSTEILFRSSNQNCRAGRHGSTSGTGRENGDFFYSSRGPPVSTRRSCCWTGTSSIVAESLSTAT